MQVDSKPEELDSIDREIVRLKIEQEALKKGADRGFEGSAQEARKRACRSSSKKSAELTSALEERKRTSFPSAQKLKTELDHAARGARQCAAAR